MVVCPKSAHSVRSNSTDSLGTGNELRAIEVRFHEIRRRTLFLYLEPGINLEVYKGWGIGASLAANISMLPAWRLTVRHKPEGHLLEVYEKKFMSSTLALLGSLSYTFYPDQPLLEVSPTGR